MKLIEGEDNARDLFGDTKLIKNISRGREIGYKLGYLRILGGFNRENREVLVPRGDLKIIGDFRTKKNPPFSEEKSINIIDKSPSKKIQFRLSKYTLS